MAKQPTLKTEHYYYNRNLPEFSARSTASLQPHFKEVLHWAQLALRSQLPYVGRCVGRLRRVEGGDEEVEYYKPGKIFRIQNLLQAEKSECGDEPCEVEF